MPKKILAFLMIFFSMFSLTSCFSDADGDVVDTTRWTGTYVWTDEETEEFKVLEAAAVDDDTVNFMLESSRITEEFDADTKSKSGRYIVTNLGPKTVKITISADGETITVDDMWTDDISLRDENWTGKYKRLLPGEEIASFGNKAWNGVYVNPDTELEVSTYGIKEGIVLFSYNGLEELGEEEEDEKDKKGKKDEEEEPSVPEEVTFNFRCLEPEPKKAVFTQNERLIILELLSNGRLKVTDLYMNDSANKGISGIYKRK